jgi:hypothetical protein
MLPTPPIYVKEKGRRDRPAQAWDTMVSSEEAKRERERKNG